MRRAWLPAVCAALQVLAINTGDSSAPGVVAGAAFLGLGLTSGASLIWRDRFPACILAFCAVAYAAQALLLAPPVPAATAVMCYELVRRPDTHNVSSARRTRSILTALTGTLVVGGTGVVASGQPSLVAPFALVVVTATAAGLLVTSHDAREEARRRNLLADQRLRIARDLHDAVGHSVSAITVQAGAARMALTAGAPSAAATAVLDIETASRALLREVRWLVGLLREDAELPGLAELDGLLGNALRSGLDLRVNTNANACTVPPQVGYAAYRILQEAITNVLRHGHGPHAEVDVQVTEVVLLRVCNPCPHGVDPPSGHGLVGMQERAADVGGTVSAGSDGAGSWVVEASLPLRVPQ